MPPSQGSKRQRYGPIFAKAAMELAAGKTVAIRPESQSDYRTIINYWYDWRRVHHGIGIKSEDPEVRRVASTAFASVVSVDTDDKGRVLIRIRPRITPGRAFSDEPIQPVDPEAAIPTLSSHHGSSAPAAEAPMADHYLEHTKPWQDWFKTWTDTNGMLHCLDSIPRELRANPDLAALDDLPPPDGPEGLAWKAKFKEDQ